MFGKAFASTFTGSMVGSGPHVFSVWLYVIANVSESVVELNPTVLAALIGQCTPAEISHAIGVLEKPDPKSRCKEYDGSRLVHIEAFRYFVVTAEHYRNLRNATDRTEYMREYMRKYMKKKRESAKSGDQLDTLNTLDTCLAHTDTDTDTESDTESESDLSSSLRSDSSSRSADDRTDGKGKPELKLVPPSPADRKAAIKARLREVTQEACESYNEILAKPNGLLATVRWPIGEKTRTKEVKRCLENASQICRDVFKSPRVTRAFWESYFTQCAEDPHKSGRLGGGKGHENWLPDFEYLTRPDVMLSVFEKAMAA